MATTNYVAVDLGAESGRVMLGRYDGATLRLEEVQRFANLPVQVPGALQWDVLRLWSDIQQGLAKSVQLCGGAIASLGVDTWAVDFGLLGRDGQLLGSPVHYRDPRTEGMMAEAFRRVPQAEIFEQTGIQFMPINSLYQLLALQVNNAPALAAAEHFLTIPDLINYWLCGSLGNEFTNATTTQCFNPRTGDWARSLLERLGLPTQLFGQVIPPGTRLGKLRPEVAEAIGSTDLQVIAPATHDTGSAVAATPLAGDAIYLSSGTWSLMGVELAAPLINEKSLAYNFTNEGGLNGTYRFLKNIMGLWLVQECRRAWVALGWDYTYAQLTQLAEQAPAFGALCSAGEAHWLAPGNMPARLADYWRDTQQPILETAGAVTRSILESLALEYRWVAERLEELTGKSYSTIHIIGGGSQNALLNQFTADATGKTVLAGPVEATALGNVLVQAIATGQLTTIDEGRAVIRRSFPLQAFEPRTSAAWDAAYVRYLELKG